VIRRQLRQFTLFSEQVTKFMKPLVLWARNQYPEPYTLRLRERTPTTITGLVKIDEAWFPFRYERASRTLLVGEGEEAKEIRLNQWGWEQ
jgi:hypothetical protein